MTTLTAAELTRLRQRPHRTRLNLSIYEPGTVFACQVNQAGITKGERTITVTALGGDPNSVMRGMTAYIGSTPGSRDLGRLRAISATAILLTVAENDWGWRNGLFITVVAYYEPWSVFPLIVLPANNIPLFYKDFNIPYTDQNLNMDPIPHMGPNHAAFLDGTPSGAFAQVYYSSSGSFDASDGLPPTGFAWVFEGGVPSGSPEPDPGYIDYTGAGHFVTSLTVTSTRGKAFTGRRHVSIYSRPDEGPNRPIVTWGLLSLEGSRDNGGYGARLWIRETADKAKVADGALVVLFSEDWEGTVKGKKGGNAQNRTSIFFNGYIEDGSVRLDPDTSRLEFRVASITDRMKRLTGFSASLESKVTPGSWNEMADLTVDKGVAHFLRWHSTVLGIADYFPTGDSRRVQFVDFARESLFQGVDSLLDSALIGSFVADRQGAIYAEVEASVVPTGSSRNFPTALTLSRQDWRDELDITIRQDEMMSYLELGGIAYMGPTTGTNFPYLAGAPGEAPAYFGSVERRSGLALRTQTQLNELVGLDFARRNARYPDSRLTMAGDYRNLDIAPQERVLVNLDADENWRGIVWNNKPFFPASIRYDNRPESQAIEQTLVLVEETHGPPGDTVEIPVDPPFDSLNVEEWRLKLPIFPPIPMPVIPLLPQQGEGNLVYTLFATKLARCRNYWDASPIWEDVTPTSVSGSLNMLRLDPWDPLNGAYLLTYGSFGNNNQTGPRIYRTVSLNAPAPSWIQVFGPAESDALLGTNYLQRDIFHIDPAISAPGVLFGAGISKQLGGGQTTLRPVRTLNYGVSWDESHAGMLADNGGKENQIFASPHVGSIGGMVIYYGQGTPGPRLYRSSNGGVTWTLVLNLAGDGTITMGGGHIPFPDNGDDQKFLYTIIDTLESDSATYYTSNGGTSQTYINFNYGGNEWRAAAGGAGYLNQAMFAHPRDSSYYGLFINSDDPAGTPKTVFAFHPPVAVYFDGLLWQVRGTFQGDVRGLEWNPGDELKWTAFGNATDGYLVGSSDGGYTWRSKVGDFDAKVAPIAGLARRNMQIVWVA